MSAFASFWKFRSSPQLPVSVSKSSSFIAIYSILVYHFPHRCRLLSIFNCCCCHILFSSFITFVCVFLHVSCVLCCRNVFVQVQLLSTVPNSLGSQPFAYSGARNTTCLHHQLSVHKMGAAIQWRGHDELHCKMGMSGDAKSLEKLQWHCINAPELLVFWKQAIH